MQKNYNYNQTTIDLRGLVILLLILFFLLISRNAFFAQSEVGHYVPGVYNIRDFVMPDSGFYGVIYSYGYLSNRLNNSEGAKIDAVEIRPGTGPALKIPAEIELGVYVVAPTFMWVSSKKIFGGKYGAIVCPSLGNTSIGASLSGVTGSGRKVNANNLGLCDLFVQPLWLGWNRSHWGLTLGYAFYAPTGKYNTEYYTLETLGELKVEEPDNIGLGFWTQQLQGGATWYPWTDQHFAMSAAITYEINGKKKDFDLKPGSIASLNWGISEFLSLRSDDKLLLEIGPAGYSSWQVSNDKGTDSLQPPTKDKIHGAGAQLGLTQVTWNASLNFHYFYEFAAADRYQGQAVGLNMGFKF